jgi:hypothetical protein
LENTATGHDILQQVPMERRKEVATRLRERCSEKCTQEKVQEIKTKQNKRSNKTQMPSSNLKAFRFLQTVLGSTCSYFRRVAATPEIHLELQERGVSEPKMSQILGSRN